MNMTQMKEQTMENKLQIRASSAERIILCPGSALAESKCPKDPGNEYTERGTRIHQFLARALTTGDVSPGSPLSDDASEFEDANTMLNHLNDLLAKHGGMARNDAGAPVVEAEIKLFGCGWTGHCDAVIMCGDGSTVLLDWKSGNTPVAPADANHQLYIYSAMLRDMGIIPETAELIAAIVTPRGCFSATYSPLMLANITIDAKKAAELAMKPDAPRWLHPDACQYCRAKATQACPESLKTAETLKQATEVIKSPDVSISTLPADVLASILDKASLLDDIVEACRKEAKARLESDAFSVPGYRLKPGREMTQIADTETAVNAVKVAGIDEYSIWQGLTISPKAVADAYKLKAGLTAKAARQVVDQALQPFTTVKKAAPSLVREKKAIESKEAA